MNDKQARDLIRWCTDFHAALGEQYHQLSVKADEPRLKATLEYLGQHEHEMQAGLERFMQTTDPALLNTWFRQHPDLSETSALEAMIPVVACDSVDDAERIASDFETRLKRWYLHLAELSETPELCELFSSLAQQSEAETRRVARALDPTNSL